MTQTPAGWYPDHEQHVLRYWDGSAWTEHTSPFPEGAAGGAVGDGSRGGPDYGSSYGYAGQPGQPGQSGQGDRDTTPDGERLAGWWVRVIASVLDGLIVFLVSIPLALPAWRNVFAVYGDYFDEVTAAGASEVSTLDLQTELAGSFAAIGLIGIAVNFVYVVAFLRWKQATPGKLALGLRVRQRATPHGLPLDVVLKRWLVQSGPQLLGFLPFVGVLAGMFNLLDGLWPLWDSRRQAIHEKWADTNVVVRRG